jgi:isopenicillin N synthase-like dioxygenase
MTLPKLTRVSFYPPQQLREIETIKAVRIFSEHKMTVVPIIDFAQTYSPNLDDRRAMAVEIRQACLKNGFFYIKSSGISADLAEGVLAAGRQFFALPEAVKNALNKKNSRAGRGYEALRGQRLEAGAQADLKEDFVMGTHIPADDPRVIAGWPQHGPNQWPEGMPDWRATLEAYHRSMVGLARRIMAALALSLDIDEDYFDDALEDSIATVRLLHYPPQDPNAGPDARGAGAHTDWGAITILLQDHVGGLQIYDGEDKWIDAPPVPGAFIVNLGDLMPRWTNGLYRSTMHRVINKSGRERYSAAFFFDGRGDYVSECIPTCLNPGEVPKYAPLSVNEHLAEMFRSTRAA